MKKFFYLAMGIEALSFLSCTKSSQYLIEKFVEEGNKSLPISVDEFTSYDSIVCHESEKNVAMYYSIKGDLVVEGLKKQDDEILRRFYLASLKKEPKTQTFLKLMEESDYSLIIEVLTKESEVIKKFNIGREEYSQDIDASQMELDKTKQMENDINSVKAMCPATVDEYTTLKNVILDLNNLKLTYYYELHDLEIEDKELAISNLRQSIEPVLKGNAMKLYKDAQITITYHYETENDTLEVIFTPEDYK